MGKWIGLAALATVLAGALESSPCATTIGSRCSGGGYITCTDETGGEQTLVCFKRTWHLA